MCLAISATVIELQDDHAWVDLLGARKKINILTVENLRVGDHVLVHAGYAIRIIDAQYHGFLEETLQALLEESS